MCNVNIYHDVNINFDVTDLSCDWAEQGVTGALLQTEQPTVATFR